MIPVRQSEGYHRVTQPHGADDHKRHCFSTCPKDTKSFCSFLSLDAICQKIPTKTVFISFCLVRQNIYVRADTFCIAAVITRTCQFSGKPQHTEIFSILLPDFGVLFFKPRVVCQRDFGVCRSSLYPLQSFLVLNPFWNSWMGPPR